MTPTLRPYLLVLGATLLGQGLVSWALDWSGHASNHHTLLNHTVRSLATAASLNGHRANSFRLQYRIEDYPID